MFCSHAFAIWSTQDALCHVLGGSVEISALAIPVLRPGLAGYVIIACLRRSAVVEQAEQSVLSH